MPEMQKDVGRNEIEAGRDIDGGCIEWAGDGDSGVCVSALQGMGTLGEAVMALTPNPSPEGEGRKGRAWGRINPTPSPSPFTEREKGGG